MRSAPEAFSVTTADLGGGHIVLSVRGEVDLATAPILDRLIGSLHHGAHRVVIDMSGVSFIDSTGAWTLVEVRRQLRQAGRDLLVEDPSPFVAKVLDLTGTADLVR